MARVLTLDEVFCAVLSLLGTDDTFDLIIVIQRLKVCLSIQIPLLLLFWRNVGILSQGLLDFDSLPVVVLESTETTKGGEGSPRFPCCVVMRLTLPFDLKYVSTMLTDA